MAASSSRRETVSGNFLRRRVDARQVAVIHRSQPTKLVQLPAVPARPRASRASASVMQLGTACRRPRRKPEPLELRVANPGLHAHRSSSASSSKSTPRSAAGTMSASRASPSSNHSRLVGQTRPREVPCTCKSFRELRPAAQQQGDRQAVAATGRVPGGRGTRPRRPPRRSASSNTTRRPRERLRANRPANLQNCFNVAHEISPSHPANCGLRRSVGGVEMGARQARPA